MKSMWHTARFERGRRMPRRDRAWAKGVRLLIKIALPSTILIAVGYGTLFSRAFFIDYVDVSVEGAIDPSQIRSYLFAQMEKNRLGIFSQKNLLAFDAREAEQTLRDVFLINSLAITKRPPNKLSLTISGKPFRALWFTGGALYEITTHGTIAHAVDSGTLSFFPRSLHALLPRVSSSTVSIMPASERAAYSPSDEAVQVPIVRDEKNTPVTTGDVVLSEEELSAILGLSRAAHDAGVHFDYMKAKSGDPDVRIVTNEGWEVLATSTQKPEPQMHALSLVIREKIKSNRKKIKYVDVRFGNRVYYQ